MGYMTMEEQIVSHLEFLRQHNFAVNELSVGTGFVRCSAIGEALGRGEICYQTKKNQLRNGLVGLATWARGVGGEVKIHKTYGQDLLASGLPTSNKSESSGWSEDMEKVSAFWQMSNELGEAEYLLKKGVGYYGIRFRCTEFGKVAIIPMRDVEGQLWSYQIINADGSKRYARDVETKSLLHMLHKPINGFPIGIAESYVTAATCFELTGLAMVTAFCANNLKAVGVVLRAKFPKSQIIVFGDNDRHLQENKGKMAATAVKNELGIVCRVAIPEFDGYPHEKEFSDWNDLVREKGVRETRVMMASWIHSESISDPQML
jgi:phage/plasmid primase-like uncharacterized protein